MTALNVTKVVNIGGLEYTIRRLNVAKSREVLAIVQPILGSFEVDETGLQDISPLLMAGMVGAMDDAALGKLTKLFGPTTTVDLNDGEGNRPPRVLTLTQEAAHDELWAGQIELMLEWLEACIRFNFSGVIAKMNAVVRAANARRSAKAEADEDSSPQS